MNNKNIDELIIKFVESKATLEEQVELRNRLEIKENRIYFEEYVELHYLLNSKIKSPNLCKTFHASSYTRN